MTEEPRRAHHVAIALVSCAVLLFEVLVTRVLSVVLWYHFVFLSISLAMLGLGAPGVWFALRGAEPETNARVLRRSLLLGGALVPLSVFAIVKVGPVFREAMTFWVIVVLAPMLALGAAVVALLLSARGKAIGRMYGADLLGATAGALLVFPLLSGLPTPQVVAAIGILPLVAVALIDASARKAALGIGIAVVASIAIGAPYRLRFTKMYVESTAPLYERWTPTARLAIFPSSFVLRDQGAAFGWGMGAKWQPKPLEQLWLEQDGSAGTPITKWDGTEALPHLMFDVTSAAYQVKRPGRVCIIGAGGGRDILTAIKSGATYIDAVELNPYTIEAVSKEFGAYSGDPYHRANVRAFAMEGRTFLSRVPRDYDVLQISLIDTWAATSAGAYTLSENALYTLEAFRLYLQRLSPNGILTVSRWASGQRQLEVSRLILLAKTALEQEGITDPDRHIVLLQAGEVGNLLVFKRTIDRETLHAVDDVAREHGFSRRWPMQPGKEPEMLVQKAMVFGAGSFRAQGFDLAPPTDDRPFFFQTIDVLHPPEARVLSAMSANEHAVVQLRRLLVIVTVATLVLFFLPFVWRKFPRAPGFGSGTAYFVAIGLAFMFVELPLIQRFTNFLGHPSRATTVVLGTMLLGAGVGSFLASRVSLDRTRVVALAIPIAAASLAFVAPRVAEGAIGASFEVRVLLVIAVAMPVAVAMGFAFPIGMMKFGDANRAWLWAVNGAASVLASVSTLALAMAFGFARVLWLGVLAYVIAAAVLATARDESA